MFILKKGHQPGVYMPLRALFLVVSVVRHLSSIVCRIVEEIYEPCCEKTGLRGFRPGPTQTGLCSH